jgi:hypothetical protein
MAKKKKVPTPRETWPPTPNPSPAEGRGESAHSSPRESDRAGGPLVHRSVKREHTDAYAGRVIAVLCICLAIGGVDIFVVRLFVSGNERHQAQVKVSEYPLAPPPSLALPREPRLDPLNRLAGTEQATAFQMIAADLAKLNEAGPAEKGFVRIPIQEAMKQVVSHLPVSKSSHATADKDNGLRYGGGPSSGRVFEENAP